VLSVLESRNLALDAEEGKGRRLGKSKKAGASKGRTKAQVDNFKTPGPKTADKARAEAPRQDRRGRESGPNRQGRAGIAVESKEERRNRPSFRADIAKSKSTNRDRTDGKPFQSALKLKGRFHQYQDSTSATSPPPYDGPHQRGVNPSTRTVWINVGFYDNLQKHLDVQRAAGRAWPPGSRRQAEGQDRGHAKFSTNHFGRMPHSRRRPEQSDSRRRQTSSPAFGNRANTDAVRFWRGKSISTADGTDDIDRVRALVRSGPAAASMALAKTTGRNRRRVDDRKRG